MTPRFPGPPAWLTRLDAWVVAHAIVPLYWVLAGTTLVVWAVLRIQNRGRDTPVRRALRSFVLAHALVWAALLSGRWLLVSWRPFPFIAVSLYAAIATLWVLIALARTYLLPKPDGDDVVVTQVPAERRTGPADRRKGER
jgi:hypothetical protein